MNLRDRIATLAQRFANEVVKAVNGALTVTLDEIAAGSRRTAPERPPRQARASRRGDGRGRSREALLAVGDQILALLGKHPGGIRAEGLRDAVGLSRADFQRPMSLLLAEGRARKTGEKRRTTYFPHASGGARAQAAAPARAGKGGAGKRGGKKAAGRKASGAASAARKPASRKPGARKTPAKAGAARTGAARKTAGQRAAGERAAGKRAAGKKAAGKKAAGKPEAAAPAAAAAAPTT